MNRFIIYDHIVSKIDDMSDSISIIPITDSKNMNMNMNIITITFGDKNIPIPANLGGPVGGNMSVGNVTRNEQPGVKTTGIKVRGTGAATKGLMARGPMA